MYMQARYYDPVIGRFYSNDPVGFTNIHTFNRYAYANNNPYKYTDPDGRTAALQLKKSIEGIYKTANNASGGKIGARMKNMSTTDKIKVGLGATGVTACALSPCGGTLAVTTSIITLSDGLTGKSAIAELLKSTGQIESDTADGIASAIDLVSGVKGVGEMLAGVATALVKKGGTWLGVAAETTKGAAETFVNQSELKANQEKVENAVE